MSATTTYLEMTSEAALRPKTGDDPAFSMEEVHDPTGHTNRTLYLAVGAAWNWVDKAAWSEEQWRDYAGQPGLRTFLATYDGEQAGYFELHARSDGVEITYFGLLQAYLGKGLGGPMLTRALQEAWADQPPRVWVHTCTEDHPAALANYRARGMRVYKTV